MMQAFPGSFPPDVFDGLPLDRYAEAYDLAVELLTAQTEAAKAGRG
ncbi:hypothetical protein [Roseospira marina]|nr:hypothetical protein [Roseospira marina]MBB4316270.1 hypothetical protein [Roseospira marina]MBB5089460.1 hypothetical protein [Roseospira marina]